MDDVVHTWQIEFTECKMDHAGETYGVIFIPNMHHKGSYTFVMYILRHGMSSFATPEARDALEWLHGRNLPLAQGTELLQMVRYMNGVYDKMYL